MTSQEVAAAAAAAFEGLTLQEKTMAEELSIFQYYDEGDRVGYFRKVVLSLAQVFSDLKEKTKSLSIPPRQIVLYCDTLVVDQMVDIGSAEQRIVTIFARSISVTMPDAHPPPPAIRFDMIKGSMLVVFAQQILRPFIIELPNTPEKLRRISIPPKFLGLSMHYDGSKIVELGQNMPNPQLAHENWLNLIKEDGTVTEEPFTKDNLPRLLQIQFLIAASQLYTNPQLALEILNWVCAATSSSSGSMVNFQAHALRHTLTTDHKTTTPGGSESAKFVANVTSVPSVNLYACKQVLNARLQAAVAFEQGFQDFLGQERSGTNWTLLGADLIHKSNNALEEFQFLSDQVKKRYGEAIGAQDVARKNFDRTQAKLNSESDAFRKHVEEWEEGQRLGAAKDILFAIVTIGVSIAATVATAGAAAPAVAASVGNVISTAREVTELWAKIKGIVKKLQEIYEKLEPAIKELGELFENVSKMVGSIQTLRNPQFPTSSLKQGSIKLDTVNALAEWDMFELQATEFKESLQSIDIDGKEEYYMAMRELVFHGRALLQAQANVIARGDELATVTLRLNHQKAAKPALDSMAKHFSTDTKVLSLLKTAMFDRLLSIRAMIFVDFHSYTNAYMFHSLSRSYPVTLSPVKPVVDYLQDAARLQSAVTEFGSKVCIQQKTFELEMPEATVKDIARGLQENGNFRFSIDPTSEEFAGVCRVRLMRARVLLGGIQAKSTSSKRLLRLALSTNGRFTDIDFPSDQASPATISIRSFVGEYRSIIFEKDLRRNAISCDGDCGLKMDYLKQSPFAGWTCKLAKGGLQANDLETSGLTSVVVQLTCEVCFLDGDIS